MAILRRCAEAARKASQAAVAILGGVSADEVPRSLGIDMLVAGGKTSTLTQFTGLARQAGLDVIAASTQSIRPFPGRMPAGSARTLTHGQVCYLQLPAADSSERPRSTKPSSAGRPGRTTRTSSRPASSASGSRAARRPETPGP